MTIQPLESISFESFNIAACPASSPSVIIRTLPCFPATMSSCFSVASVPRKAYASNPCPASAIASKVPSTIVPNPVPFPTISGAYILLPLSYISVFLALRYFIFSSGLVALPTYETISPLSFFTGIVIRELYIG